MDFVIVSQTLFCYIPALYQELFKAVQGKNFSAFMDLFWCRLMKMG